MISKKKSVKVDGQGNPLNLLDSPKPLRLIFCDHIKNRLAEFAPARRQKGRFHGTGETAGQGPRSGPESGLSNSEPRLANLPPRSSLPLFTRGGTSRGGPLRQGMVSPSNRPQA